MAQLEFPHLFFRDAPDARDFTTHQTGRNSVNFPDRSDRKGHAGNLRRALNDIWTSSRKNSEERKAVSLPTRTGTYIEFQSSPDFDLTTKSLDLRQQNIRLLNVDTRPDETGSDITYATVFVPQGRESVLLKRIDQYENEQVRSGKPKHLALVASINHLREAVLNSFWRDKPELIPVEQDWCEAWLRFSEEPERVAREFLDVCDALGLETQDGFLVFPERVVCLVNASQKQLEDLLLSSDDIAEFRAAKATAGFWMNLDNAHQAEWASDLANRLSVERENKVSACLLDTGANNGHVLLQEVLADSDCHSVDPEWSSTDDHGHGTQMCGLAAFGGDLDMLLQSAERVVVPFTLESVKLIPEPGIHHSKRLYGLRTMQAISRAELENPDHKRAVCLAITSDDHRDEGRPSSWSGSLDQICAGSDDDTPRLVIAAAGNVDDPNEWKSYPDSNLTQAVHDPGQAWNALTIGAYTEKTDIQEEELSQLYEPIA